MPWTGRVWNDLYYCRLVLNKIFSFLTEINIITRHLRLIWYRLNHFNYNKSTIVTWRKSNQCTPANHKHTRKGVYIDIFFGCPKLLDAKRHYTNVSRLSISEIGAILIQWFVVCHSSVLQSPKICQIIPPPQFNILKSTSTHWGRDKMAAFSQTTHSNEFSGMKILEFRLNFHWNLFLRVLSTIFHYWFWWWLGADQATSHYLNQWCLVYRRIYASLSLNELMGQILPKYNLFHFFTEKRKYTVMELPFRTPTLSAQYERHKLKYLEPTSIL